ncbi:MAG: ATP-binding protein [Candidatus Nomurabacteria bacterium]|jgi:predicted AAA+ superfamily ATPase|nr:ATP-binding protein [Candidatus Nomurabacteria bacterium]
MIKRQAYLDKLHKLCDQNIIKIITGVRRSGKSTLFKQFQQELIDSGIKPKHIISLNLEEMENEALLERHVLNDYIMRIADEGAKNYIFLDEIQKVPEFEKLVDSLYAKDFIDLYITGSNAYMLSSELATFLSGRYIEIKILPFSFAEYFGGSDGNSSELFARYMETGGMPEVLNLINAGAKSEVDDYLRSVYQTVLERDITQKKQIRNKADFEVVLKFTTDSIGSLISPNKIATRLSEQKNIVNKTTVDSYLLALVDSFVFYKAERYDIKGRNILQTLNKYYLVDTGFIRILLGKDSNIDRGHILENIVYLELLRRHAAVWVGKVDQKEVDFVVRTESGDTEYYQVSETINGEQARERELAPFDKIRNHNAKYLLTLDAGSETYNGVKRLYVVDWLLGSL